MLFKDTQQIDTHIQMFIYVCTHTYIYTYMYVKNWRWPNSEKAKRSWEKKNVGLIQGRVSVRIWTIEYIYIYRRRERAGSVDREGNEWELRQERLVGFHLELRKKIKFAHLEDKKKKNSNTPTTSADPSQQTNKKINRCKIQNCWALNGVDFTESNGVYIVFVKVQAWFPPLR